MVIGKLIGAKPADGPPPVLTPEVGAAGLLIVAAHKDGVSTEVERQQVSAALMKLLHLPGPKAAALRAEAERFEEDAVVFAQAAADLPPDEREGLVTALWSLSEAGPDDAPNLVMDAVADAFAVSPERLAALRPVP